MRTSYLAVLFDLDGTLIDSTAAVRRAWRRWAVEEGVDVRRLAGMSGKPAKRIVADLLPPDRFDAALARYTHIATHDLDGVVVLPGAAEALRATGDRRAIVTSSSRDVTVARMAATGLRPPAVVVTAEDVPRGKPDPAAYLLGARLLGVPPARCLVVEDTTVGVAAGRAAGCTVLAVGGTVPVGPDGPHFAVEDLSAVRFDTTPGEVVVTYPDRLAAA
ncbi:MAG TPA: HAD-IA family hydrolase [Actinophytocola sp.]|uniref:HAD-IA family hydrolase n=1 Tax=Actinophytocola sp. TaxID=1872138 RepID=UPI002DDCE2DD|nr:HAD-IA family hydrolase [Actinophytocola sp.]HEV2783345.1 HAD-IA family hydrolase [Actinophytocola sp.]